MSELKFRRLGTMVDCSRNAVMTPDTLKRWIDITADMGYNNLQMYIEDTYELDGEPYFGHLRGRYTQQQLREIDDYAASRGMELIPCIQTLAHLGTIFHWSAYAAHRDADDILLAGDEDVYALIDKMFATLSSCLRSRIINIGMDEALMLGRGKYQDLHGNRDKFDILLEHLQRVAQIGKKYGLELLMWGDMFFRLASGGGSYYLEKVSVSDHVKSMIPENVNLVYWDYYAVNQPHYDKQAQKHIAVKKDIWFAGGLWTWSGITPHNAFSLQSMGMALRSCLNNGIQDVFMTMWGDDGGECSKFAMLPSLYCVSQYARGNWDMDSIKAGFYEKFGIPFDAFMLLDLLGTPNDVDKAIRNPDKYMLYCDCFMGQFDNRVVSGQGASYGQCAQKLAQWENHPTYGYLFRTQRTLCEVLEIKYELGVRTRKAYLENDRQGMTSLVDAYNCLLEKLDVFYQAYRKQWMLENKRFGFEVQDHRIGGLKQRVANCRDLLQDYLNGSLDKLEELEQPVLDVRCQGEEANGVSINYNGWAYITTPAVT